MTKYLRDKRYMTKQGDHLFEKPFATEEKKSERVEDSDSQNLQDQIKSTKNKDLQLLSGNSHLTLINL